MAKPARAAIEEMPLYERDYARWAEEQGRKLRARSVAEIDWDNVAEEIESLGRTDKRSIDSNLAVLLLHLLKWQVQPEKRKGGWRSSIVEHRHRIAKLVRESPSLRSYPAEALVEEYGFARAKAIDETGLPETAIPRECPFAIEDVLDRDFWPE